MREFRTLGSARGAARKGRPYRDPNVQYGHRRPPSGGWFRLRTQRSHSGEASLLHGMQASSQDGTLFSRRLLSSETERLPRLAVGATQV